MSGVADQFDLVWATTWGEAANRVYSDLLELPNLPMVPLGELPRLGTRKLAPVKRFVGDRALAWVDDELYGRCPRSGPWSVTTNPAGADAGLDRAHS